MEVNDIKIHRFLFFFVDTSSSFEELIAQQGLHPSNITYISINPYCVLHFSCKFTCTCESSYSAVLTEISSIEFSS